MKKILIILLSLFVFFPAIAQKSGKDLVYLKSGGIIKGKLSVNNSEKVRINSAGNEWVFNISEVDSVVQFSNKQKTADVSNYFFIDNSIGFLVGNSGNNQKAPFTFMSSVNFRLTENVFAGFGLGAEFLDESYMPAFGQLQYRFRNSNFTPFVNLQLGYMVALEEGNKENYYNYYSVSSIWPYPQQGNKLSADGGLMFSPSVGFQKFTSDNFGWFFSFGYRHHKLNYSGENEYKLETNYSRLSLKIGFIFN